MKLKNKLVKTENEGNYLSGGFVIPYEVADSITLGNLADARKYLRKDLKRWKKNPKTESNPDGYWLHPEDAARNIRLIEAMDLLIDYYGGIDE